MRQRTVSVVAVVVVLGVMALCPQRVLADPCLPCEALTTVDLGPEVMIFSAQVSSEVVIFGPDGPMVIPVPEHCDVRGLIAPEQMFNVKLPTATWNNRFYMVGNGVAGGAIQEDAMIPGLFQGFATAGTDTGHQGSPLDWSFGYNPPDNSNPNAEEKLIDYYDESIHETTQVGKALVDAYYCAAPEYAYYVGCSTGGRQGLIEAQRYPEDFDGILVGAPVHYLAEIQMRGIWEGTQLLGPGNIDVTKLPLLAAAVMGKCDSIDGLVDGLIDDPLACDFDARVDLPVCEGDVDGPDCFTAAQRNAVFAIYDGPRDSSGALLTFGEAFGSEAWAPEGSGWIPWVVWPGGPVNGLGLLVGADAIQHIGLDPAPGPGWDFTTFDFDADWTNVMDNLAPLCNAVDPDLSAFNNAGGKMIHYDGWADPATGPYQTYDYFQNVLDTMGAEEADAFYKLYMIPGMFHCGGGLGCYDFDALFAALRGWVEAGIEPSSYNGTRPDGGRTRPMCPYPSVARYLGEGSIDDAASFVCATPTPTEVSVKPSTLDIGSHGKLTAKIAIPEDVDLRGWELVSVVCEGAPAIKVKLIKKRGHCRRGKGGFYLAKFDRRDLVNIAPGEVVFTATAIFQKDGESLSLEGSDVILVTQ